MSNRTILLIIFIILCRGIIENLFYFYKTFYLRKIEGNNRDKAKSIKLNFYKILWGILSHYLVVISFLMLYYVYKYYGV